MLSAFGFFTTEEEIQDLFEQELEDFTEEIKYTNLDLYILSDGKVFVFEEGTETISTESLVVDLEKNQEAEDELSEELYDLAKQFDQPVKFTVVLMSQEDPEVEDETVISKLSQIFDQLEMGEGEGEDDDNE